MKNLLREVKDGLIEDGTAIGMGLATAVSRLKDSKAKSKVVILLTDGMNNSGFIDPSTAADLAEQNGIKVYTIGIGKYGKAPYPVKNFWGKESKVDIDVEIDEKPISRIFGLSSISVYTAGDSSDDLEIKGIKKETALQIKEFISSKINE